MAAIDTVVFSLRLPLDDDWAWAVLKDLFPEMRVEYWYDSRGKLLRQTAKHMYVGMTAVGDVYKLRHQLV